jgi:hypothetical protein
MGGVTETTPFVGASKCYGRAYKLLKWMGEGGGHVIVHKDKKGKLTGCTPSDEMNRRVEALNKGDEDTIKGYLLDPRYFDIIHAN